MIKTIWENVLQSFGVYNLKNEVVKKYGEEYGRIYEDLCRGTQIGGFTDTIYACEKIESVKEEMECKNIFKKIFKRVLKDE